jgi:hypothetical protein
MQHQLDAFQGKATAINSFSKTDLVDLEDELNQTLLKIKDRKA